VWHTGKHAEQAQASFAAEHAQAQQCSQGQEADGHTREAEHQAGGAQRGL